MEEQEKEPKPEKSQAADFDLSDGDISKLSQQVQVEVEEAKKFIEPKQAEWYKRLKLYNNQRRDKQAVGDPLLFTITQTIIASLYSDRLTVEWEGREEGDDEVADNLNIVSVHDAGEMHKPIMDFYWIWDTVFFGKGYIRMSEYNRDKKIPVPELLDPLTFLRDPKADCINALVKGQKPARYFGREIEATIYQLEEIKAHKNLDLLKEQEARTDDLVKKARSERDEAQGREVENFAIDNSVGDNKMYELVEWYTYWNGKKVFTVWGNAMKTLVRYEVIKEKDNWPIIERSLYPLSHDFDGTSVPDLVEDKQRRRSVAQNLGIKMMEIDLNPMYLYDSDRIANRADLNFQANKAVAVKANGGDVRASVQPMNKATPNMQFVDFILRSMDEAAQKATATPDIQQGILSKTGKTATELNQTAANVDTRYSLSAKIFGWSERLFWLAYYSSQKTHLKDTIDEKVVRLVGAWGTQWRKLGRDNLIAKGEDPDVKIESKALSDAERMKKQAAFERYLGLLLKDPTANHRFGFKMLGKLSGFDKDEIDRLLPPTLDELVATEENEKLDNNKLDEVKVSPNDDHQMHLEIHTMAADTPATRAHIKTHKQAMVLKRNKPDLFPQAQEQAMMGAGAEAVTPNTPSAGGAASLGGELANNNPITALFNK